MSDNLQSLSERQGLEHGVFDALKANDESRLKDLAERSHIPKIQLYGAKSFYEMDKDKITKKNFFGKCDFETRDIEIPFYSHTTDSVYDLKLPQVSEYYDLVLANKSKIQTELNAAGLTGRGGAGFPFAKKLEICAAQNSEIKYVVCNGEEGDTGSFSDKYLLESQPHLVLAGMYAAGVTVGAKLGILYISDEYHKAIEIIKAEIAQFEQTQAFKKENFEFLVVKGDNAYITGEESALLNSLEGQRAEVRTRPPFPGQEGLFKKPTLLSNVETFASIVWILNHGGVKHAALGTTESCGTKLVSLGAKFNKPGVHEVAFGEPLEKVLNEYGGGFTEEIKALQIGGPLGGVVPMSKVSELNLSIESFREAGFLLGHASIVAISESVSMLQFLRELLEFVTNESCGKCFPCRLGSKAGEQMIAEALQGAKINPHAFNDLVETLELGSLCGLGGGVPVPIKNILQHFSGELDEYFKGGLK